MRLNHKTKRFHFELLERRRLLSFAIAGDYPAGYNPQAVVAADLNGDGRADLAVANSYDRTVSVLFGNANGTFGAAQAFPANPNGGQTVSVTAGDFNGDGKNDLVTANEYAPPAVLLGNGDGTFQNPQPMALAPPEPPPGEFITSYYATDVAVADANGDGKLDLLFTGEAEWYSDGETGGAYGYIAASLGQGNGTFSPSLGVLGSYNSGVAAADLNADARIDLVTADEVRFGVGNGAFAAAQNIRASMWGADVTVADFNGDGKPDIATANVSHVNYPSNGGNVLLSNGDGTFQPTQGYVSGVDPRSLATADFNGDGKTDLVTANAGDAQGIGRTVTVCLGNGNGTFQAALSFPGSPASWALAGLTVADFNLDGRLDVGVIDYGSNLRVLLNDGNWATRTYTGPARGGNWSTAANWSPSGVPTASDVVAISGKSVNLDASVTVASLTLTGGATLTVTAAGNRMLRTSSLSISSDSKLNLNDNGLILDYTGSSPLTLVRDLIVSGRNGGAWNGSGITSSVAAAVAGTGPGFGEATHILSAFPASFLGQSVDATSILMRYTLLGDANLDGGVDITDLGRVATSWQHSPRTFAQGDFDYDGVVNVADLGMLSTNWHQSLTLAPRPLAPDTRPARRTSTRLLDELI